MQSIKDGHMPEKQLRKKKNRKSKRKKKEKQTKERKPKKKKKMMMMTFTDMGGEKMYISIICTLYIGYTGRKI